jgi:hypothetical protein
MDFLRRILGQGEGTHGGGKPSGGDEPSAADAPTAPVDPDEAESAYQRGLLRDEEARLDELRRRQLRYAEHAWTPPPQGGERRAGDEDAGGTGGG